jgi:hypothetical protein
MHLRRSGTALGVAVLTVLTIPTSAQAAGVACGGGASTGRVSVNGCISAERQWFGDVPYREVTAYIKLHNTGPRAVAVSFEAEKSHNGGPWKKVGNSRTTVGAGQTVGPTAVGSDTEFCDGQKVVVRVHAKAAGGGWSNWSQASTKQCQT